jgi:hypothetical protein
MFFGKVASGERLDGADGIRLISGQFETIHAQEDIDDGERDALVAVREAVTACQRKAVRCCEARQRRRRLGVRVEIDRATERRFEAR